MKAKIKELRKERNLDLKEVSRITKIRIEILEQIEDMEIEEDINEEIIEAIKEAENKIKNIKDIPTFPKKTIIATPAVYKGGVGKTSSCINLAGALAEMGYRVLLIDGAGQANGTVSLTSNLEEDELPDKNIFHCIDQEGDIRDYIIETENPLIDLVPSGREMERVESCMVQKPCSNQIFRVILDDLRKENKYDFVFIDTSSQMGLFDDAICMIPDIFFYGIYRPQAFSIQSYTPMMRRIEQMKRYNESIRYIGIILSEVDKRVGFYEKTRAIFNEVDEGIVFDKFVRRDENINKAQEAGIPVNFFKKNCNASVDYTQVAYEFIERIKKNGGE